MKAKRKLLALTKINVAKINSFRIVAKGGATGMDCVADESRTPKGGATQSTSYNIHCETGT
ncbi:hypothetical protein [Kordia sp.]|uniref:hypothetical protein n=1 Tax=Kordia sp. TaxID=1965332 RepID=UPI003D6C0A1B